jgi:hypothetical protein
MVEDNGADAELVWMAVLGHLQAVAAS